MTDTSHSDQIRLSTQNRPWCVFDKDDNFQARFATPECAAHSVAARGREQLCYIIGPAREYYDYQAVCHRWPLNR